LDQRVRPGGQDGLDVLHVADLHAAEGHRGSLVEPLHGPREVEREAVPPGEPVPRAQGDDGHEDDGHRPQDENAYRPGVGAGAHSGPRLRNALTFGSGLSRSSLGLPLAVMTFLSPSRNTALSPSAKMLASSWVTSTIVVPALSRCSRIRSSSRRELKGSSPAEGSSR